MKIGNHKLEKLNKDVCMYVCMYVCTPDTKKQLDFVSHTCTHCGPIFEGSHGFQGDGSS